MAKSSNGLGQFSGKLGGSVFVVSNGQQVIRAYQPNVSNPKSAGQNLQRAKGNLVGRLSAITPRDAIIGLGANNRQRRAAYLRNALLKSTASISDGIYTAKLQPSDLLFSKGSEIPVIVTSAVEISVTGVVTITYNRIAQVTRDEWNAAGGIFVAVAVDSVSGDYDFVRVYQWNKPNYPATSGEVVTETFTIERVTEHSVFIYFVPFVLASNVASTVTGGVAVDASAYVARLGLTDAATNLSYGNTLYVGEAVVS